MYKQQDYLDNLVPKDDNLEVYWYRENEVKTYTIVCKCGNNRLLKAENGIRCPECSRFHSHIGFEKAKAKLRKKVNFQKGMIEKIPQPFLRKIQNTDKLLRRPKINSNQRNVFIK